MAKTLQIKEERLGNLSSLYIFNAKINDKGLYSAKITSSLIEKGELSSLLFYARNGR